MCFESDTTKIYIWSYLYMHITNIIFSEIHINDKGWPDRRLERGWMTNAVYSFVSVFAVKMWMFFNCEKEYIR